MMQNILNRLAKVTTTQTKLSKPNNLPKVRKVKFALAQDLEASVANMQTALNEISVDVPSEVDNINQAVANLNIALSQYKRLDDTLQKFLEVSDQYMTAASELGIEVDPDALYADILNQVSDKFDRSIEYIGNLDEIVAEAGKIVDEMPIPYL